MPSIMDDQMESQASPTPKVRLQPAQLSINKLSSEKKAGWAAKHPLPAFNNLLGQSQSMVQLSDIVKLVSQSDTGASQH